MKTIGILKHNRAGDPEDRIAFHARKMGWQTVQINPFELMLPIRTTKGAFREISSVISRCEIRGAQFREYDQYLRALGYFESSNIPIINNAQSVINTQDKYRSHVLMVLNGIPTPISYLVHNKEQAFSLLEGGLIAFPLVLKDPYGSRGTAVFKIDDKEALEGAFVSHFRRISPLVQEFLHLETDTEGRVGDLRVWVVRGAKTEKPRFAGAYHRFAPDKSSILTNLSTNDGGYGGPMGGHVSNLIRYSKKVLDALGADVLGVDVAKTTEGRLYVIEANITMDTTPEWREWAGVDIWKNVVELAIARAVRMGARD